MDNAGEWNLQIESWLMYRVTANIAQEGVKFLRLSPTRRGIGLLYSSSTDFALVFASTC